MYQQVVSGGPNTAKPKQAFPVQPTAKSKPSFPNDQLNLFLVANLLNTNN